MLDLFLMVVVETFAKIDILIRCYLNIVRDLHMFQYE